jgi:hypothetical protein
MDPKLKNAFVLKDDVLRSIYKHEVCLSDLKLILTGLNEYIEFLENKENGKNP